MENFDQKLDAWLAGCQKKINDYFAQNFPSLTPPVLSVSRGVKYARIERNEQNGLLVFAFIDLSNGNVLKAAGWKTPAKHARGNIFDESNGLALVGPYGPAYLR